MQNPRRYQKLANGITFVTSISSFDAVSLWLFWWIRKDSNLQVREELVLQTGAVASAAHHPNTNSRFP